MCLWGFQQFEDAAALCVDELLSNVAKHTDSLECVLLVRCHPAGVRVTVSDSSSELPSIREVDWRAESGRGLVLLDGVSDTWGVEVTAGGKDVWVEFRSRSAAREAAR